MKRIFDIVGAGLALLLFSPLMVLIGCSIFCVLGPPVFFKQTRPGLYGKPFQMIKFRTMIETTDSTGQPLPDLERLTKLGRFLRSSSLDELPELWNVIKSDMSLVGPRPLLMEYLPLYSPEQARRHEVRPGITGLAQINGRNRISWDERFALDVWYVDNNSFWIDLKVIFLTVLKVIRREGISAAGEATNSKFTGDRT